VESSGGFNGDGGGCPPIDRMHLKTSKNFAPKCMIFALSFHKFSGEGAQPLPGPTPTLLPPIPNFCIRHWWKV